MPAPRNYFMEKPILQAWCPGMWWGLFEALRASGSLCATILFAMQPRSFQHLEIVANIRSMAVCFFSVCHAPEFFSVFLRPCSCAGNLTSVLVLAIVGVHKPLWVLHGALITLMGDSIFTNVSKTPGEACTGMVYICPKTVVSLVITATVREKMYPFVNERGG